MNAHQEVAAPDGGTSAGTAPTPDLAPLLAERLTAVWGAPARILTIERLSGGASRETWAVDAADADGRIHRLILRRAPEAATVSAPLVLEAAAMQAATAAGVPGPIVHDVCDGGDGTAAHILMERVDGETIPRRILRDARYERARTHLAADLGRALATIHAITPEDVVGLPTVRDPIDHMVATLSPDSVPSPALQLGLRHLRDDPCPPGPIGLVHGDFRLGNVIVAESGLAAVLDWELVHRGDPLEDLGWLCAKVWRFGSELPVGGVGSRSDLLDAYAEVAGWRPTEAQLHWWELFATVRWGLMCGVQARRNRSGTKRSVELAAIGRRACEQDFDVLLSLGHATPEPAPDVLDHPPAPASEAPHGDPTQVELLATVREYLQDAVVPQGGRTGFLGRVAANVLDTVQRQILLGSAQHLAHRDRLVALGCADDDELAVAIAKGTLDDRMPEVVAAVRDSVRAQLMVTNPGHLTRPAC